ncbi:MAG: SAM-dependent chlorinase/fluorinase [Draconibacterium sp.]
MLKNNELFLVILVLSMLFVSCNEDLAETEPEQNLSVVILTDYSIGSDIVISIEGQLISRYPGIDIHYFEAKPFSIAEASYQLQVAAENYPEGTYFLALIEPGADAERMVFKTEKNQLFVTPNNSLVTKLFHEINTSECFRIENDFWCNGLNPENQNFLTVYVSSMCDLVDGRLPADFGSKIDLPETFAVQDAVFENDTLSGQIDYSDNFGNCITNIPGSMLAAFEQGDLLEVQTTDTTFFALLGTSYSSVSEGQNVLFANSLNKLELAVNMGSLSKCYNIGAGTTIHINLPE